MPRSIKSAATDAHQGNESSYSDGDIASSDVQESLHCFDFRGFVRYSVKTIDEVELLRMDESVLLEQSRSMRGLAWDGEVWGVSRSQFASLYYDYTATGVNRGWSRFDNVDENATYPPIGVRVRGRFNDFGWMGVAPGRVFVSDDLERDAPVRASADSIGRLLPLMIDPEAEFKARYIDERDAPFQRERYELDGRRSIRLSSTIRDDDNRPIHRMLHIYERDADSDHDHFRLMLTFPNRGTSQIVSVRYRSVPCDGKVLPIRIEQLRKAYEGTIESDEIQAFESDQSPG